MSGSTMVYYILVATTGEVMQFGVMTSDLFSAQTNAIQITQAQYNTLQAGGRYLYFEGQLTAIPASAPALAEAIVAAQTTIDSQAESTRQLFMTPGSGQALVYYAKAQEANLFLETYPTAADVTAAQTAGTFKVSSWPFMTAELNITGPDYSTVAGIIAGLQSEWVSIASSIEHLRLGAKLAVSNATTLTQINEALQISWPTVANPWGQISCSGGLATSFAASGTVE